MIKYANKFLHQPKIGCENTPPKIHITTSTITGVEPVSLLGVSYFIAKNLFMRSTKKLREKIDSTGVFAGERGVF